MFKKLIGKIKINLLRNFLNKRNKIHRTVKLSNDIILGSECVIKTGTIIGNNVELKNNVIIGRNVYLQNITINSSSVIECGVVCTGYGSGKISIGKESYIGIRNILDWSDNVTIGDFVHIAGPSTGLWTHSSAKQALAGLKLDYKGKDYRPTAPIIIEDNVYIGGNCTIYPGVTIHHHSIVAPNSAVTKDVEPYTLVGGVPAKFIKRIEIKN